MNQKPKAILGLRIFTVLTFLVGFVALIPGVLSPLSIIFGMRVPTAFLGIAVLALAAHWWRRTNRLEKEMMRS